MNVYRADAQARREAAPQRLRKDAEPPPACLEEGPACTGTVEYRTALSGTGKSFPRCQRHWEDRLDRQEELNRRYPVNPPSDWSPYDAGEAWSEEDY